MLNKIFKWFKNLICLHDWERVPKYVEQEIGYTHVCKKCGRVTNL